MPKVSCNHCGLMLCCLGRLSYSIVYKNLRRLLNYRLTYEDIEDNPVPFKHYFIEIS